MRTTCLVRPSLTPRTANRLIAGSPYRRDTLALKALPGTPKQMAGYSHAERERCGRLIKAHGIKLN